MPRLRPANVELARTIVARYPRPRSALIPLCHVAQQQDDPTRWVLVEVYRDAEAPAAHKATTHYATWRDAVEPMMAEPRRSVKYAEVFPLAAGWEMK